jgi:hypothetical protein
MTSASAVAYPLARKRRAGDVESTEDRSGKRPARVEVEPVRCTAEWSAGVRGILHESTRLAAVLIGMVDEYAQARTFTFEYRRLVGPSRSVTLNEDDRVGDVFAHYIAVVGRSAELDWVAPLEQWLPHLNRRLGDVGDVVPNIMRVMMHMGPCPSWMRNCHIVAAFRAGLDWPPWRNPCYSSRTGGTPAHDLASFASDPFNGNILGSWNAFGQGEMRVPREINNDIWHLVGLRNVQDGVLKMVRDRRPPEDRDVIWVNRHSFVETGEKAVDRLYDAMYDLQPLDIIDCTTWAVDSSYAACLATAIRP